VRVWVRVDHDAGDALFSGSPAERFEAGLSMLLDGIQRRAEAAQGESRRPSSTTS
jgi:hypothetical protein